MNNEEPFIFWLYNNHPEICERYLLTNIKINGKIHVWMSPTVQEYWIKYFMKDNPDD